MVSESELPRYIGPKIRLASGSAPPRATLMGNTSGDSPGYASIGPPSTPGDPESVRSKPGSQPGWTVDPSSRDSGAPSSDSGDSPESNNNNPSSHFVLNSNPLTSSPQAASPSDCGIYVHPSDIIDGNETTLAVDHTYACPPVDDTTLLDEGKGDEICETNFDSDVTSSTIVAVATISSSQSAPSASTAQQPVEVEHIRSSKGQLYAVVSKGAMAEGTPAAQKGIRVENGELGFPLATSTLKAEGARQPPQSPSLLKLPPENVKAEQIAELKQLPSIGKMRVELERRMKGEEPKRLSTPRRMAPEVPQRASVPQSVQDGNLVVMPTPPPMKTHPGVMKREEHEREKKQSSKVKKRAARSKSAPKEQPPAQDPPPPSEIPSGDKAKRRLSGSVATPISPHLNEGSEVKEAFRSVTRRDWNFDMQLGQVPSTFSTANATPTTTSLTPTLTHTGTHANPLIYPLDEMASMRSTLPKVKRTVSPTGHYQLPRRSSRNIHDLVPGVKQPSGSQSKALEQKKPVDATQTAAEVPGGAGQGGTGQRVVTETLGRVPVGPMNTKRDIKKRRSILRKK